MECRICLKQSDNTMDIFSEENQHLMISDIIYKHLDFRPLPNNVTTVICTKCWSRLYEFDEFFQIVQNAQYQFNKLHRQQQRLVPDQDEQTEIDPSNNITVDNKLSELNDILHEPMNVELEKKDYFAINAKVEENPLDESHTATTPAATTIYPMVCFSDSSNDELKLFKTENFSCSDSDNDSGHFRKPSTNYSKNHNINNKNSNTKNLSKSKHIIKKDIKEKKVKQFNPKNPNTNTKASMTIVSPKLSETEMTELINKHISMACDLCAFLGQSFTDLKEHFSKEHPQEKPYVKCCNRQLSEHYYLTKHALIHADPNQFKCIDCEKTFANNRFLRAHNLTYHANDERNSNKCDGIIYKCNECHIECKSRVGLSNHKRHVHTNKMLCEICGKSFTKAIALKEHMTQHTGKALYTCPFCSRTFNAKSNMYAHKKRMHPMGWEKPNKQSNTQNIMNLNSTYATTDEKGDNDYCIKYYIKK